MITGNWKMFKSVDEALEFVKNLAACLPKSQASVGIAAPFTALLPMATLVDQMGMELSIGAQNMHDAEEGAFTGEISAKMVRDCGATFVILGHSERRHIFGESNEFVNRKVKRALASGLEVILCVGESLEEREAGRLEEVLKSQLLESLEGVESLEHVTIAYEPVWAIGTGKVATPEDAQRAHAFCRQLLAKSWSEEVSIQYGGSVKPENAKALLGQEDVDGLLVGGASLSAESFAKIVKES
ncbi:MAG: Triosephosphate isomerase [Chlamydiales bacterium]|nr:Triosephosphate isomerase [Chlamydiales bacterium]MCH9635821.1 Triosephosphate isomerase [Chlamydiales bacterium]